MPRARADTGRIELRSRPQDKAVLTRAAAIERLDLTGQLDLTERDSLRILDLLEHPPAAPARLVRAAKAGHRLE